MVSHRCTNNVESLCEKGFKCLVAAAESKYVLKSEKYFQNGKM